MFETIPEFLASNRTPSCAAEALKDTLLMVLLTTLEAPVSKDITAPRASSHEISPSDTEQNDDGPNLTTDPNLLNAEALIEKLETVQFIEDSCIAMIWWFGPGGFFVIFPLKLLTETFMELHDSSTAMRSNVASMLVQEQSWNKFP
ncbi:hypothetical protein [Bradyrhizobium sp. CB1015]|uniref:hypothetical protein n=1 Tax=Bradyrhizobium sp. CB1015 TaxID=2976822 RepID=UPI0021A9EFF6|nr:hypothetical protein [Bradyrhizobium sp. CB1015]UWU91387.1 hypothetical protein N2604_33910 [Bradyrhizobium sp. CB1015]